MSAVPAARAGTRTYVPRSTERGLLQRVVRDAVPALREELERRDRQLPRFVERELDRFTRCGVLSEGLARFVCSSCGAERLVALSCKGRGFCPSCLGRRMVERSAHLVDRVLPYAPVRHWVLSLPFELRYRLAWDHELCRAVLRVFTRALHSFIRERVRLPKGTPRVTGSVTVVQRFGAALNLNVHFHTLAIDGAFSERGAGELRFHAARPPKDAEVEALLAKVRTRIMRLLVRRGLLEPETGVPGPDFDANAPALADLYAASVRQRLSVGERAGKAPLRVRSAATVPAVRSEHSGRHGARLDGFDLHASAAVRAKNRDRLERLARYLLRPPLASDRLSESRGLVLLALRRPWSDGSTHIAFEPVELLERLTALVPRPNANLILYHGVLAAHARLRPRVVRFGRPHDLARPDACDRRRRNPGWADLMRRGLGLDVLACPACAGRMQHRATILEPAAVRRILEHLALSSPPTAPHGARAPPVTPAVPPSASAWRAKLDRLAGSP